MGLIHPRLCVYTERALSTQGGVYALNGPYPPEPCSWTTYVSSSHLPLLAAPCNVEVSVALVHTQAEMTGPSVCQHIQKLMPEFGMETDESAVAHDLDALTREDSLDLDTVVFCEPVSVCIHPLPENSKV